MRNLIDSPQFLMVLVALHNNSRDITCIASAFLCVQVQYIAPLLCMIEHIYVSIFNQILYESYNQNGF